MEINDPVPLYDIINCRSMGYNRCIVINDFEKLSRVVHNGNKYL